MPEAEAKDGPIEPGPGPREVIGGNRPPLARSIAAEEGDFALVTTAFLEDEYAKQPPIVQSLLDEATTLLRDPTSGELMPIADDAMKGRVASLIKRMRDAAKNLAAFHGKEKGPYLRGGQAVDQFFFGLIDKLGRREKRSRPGAADVLGQMLTDYDQRKLEEHLAEQRRIQQEEARRAAAARAEQERQEREAEEARQAEARARKAENKEAHAEVAKAAEQQADTAGTTATIAESRAEEARIEQLRRPADIMRTRGDDGTLTTMAQETYAEITNRTELDLTKLGPYIPLDGLQRALNAWAKLTDYREPMAGAAIGRRPKSVVR